MAEGRLPLPSVTAEAVALIRARERQRPESERILDDPYAERFLSFGGRLALRWSRWSPLVRVAERLDPGLEAFVASRHRYIDDQLAAALADGVRQVMLLGAGYDSRAYRFCEQLGGRPVFEVDLPAISRRKAQVVSQQRGLPAPVVERVEIDFEAQRLGDVLDAAAFERGQPTFVVWEGVSMYLTRDTVKATLTTVHELCGPGTLLAMDLWHLVDGTSSLDIARRAAPHALALIGEPVTFGLHPEDLAGFVGPLGWDVADLATADELGRRLGCEQRAIDPSGYLVTLRRDASSAAHTT